MGSFDRSDLKERNRATVYSLFATKRAYSKADIARESGISAPTVQKIVEYFESLNLLVSAGEEEYLASADDPLGLSLGRRPQPLRLNPDSVFTLGVEYDGLRLSIGLIDAAGSLRSLVHKKITENVDTLIDNYLEAQVLESIATAGLPKEKIAGLGIGLPGTVDQDHHILRFAPLVGITAPLDLSVSLATLEGSLGFPVVVENDANAAALGEYACRFDGDPGDLLFAVLGRGFGAGIVLDGRLRRGKRYFAGEIGYMVFDPLWHATFSKPGWLEVQTDLASFWKEAERERGPSEQALRRVADYLAVSVTDICIVLDIQKVVLGGLQRLTFGERLLELIQERVNRLSVLDLTCEAPLAQEPGVMGAGRLALDRWLKRVFEGP
jgi:predicted NBD/HSP70 family sugar kinase